MIHDPEIRVECDGCGNSVTITPTVAYFPNWVIEDELRELGWICRDGKQFCCERCANKDL